jgi:hypothetical protein
MRVSSPTFVRSRTEAIRRIFRDRIYQSPLNHRHVYTVRMFSDSQPLARVAFLENQQALEMLVLNPRGPWYRMDKLYKAAQRSQHVHRLYSHASELFQNYRVLVADPYAVRCLPAETQSALRSFLEEGGIVVAVDADWSTSREDMEDEKLCTAAMAGVVYDTAAPTAAVSFEWQGQKIALDPAMPRRAARLETGTVVLAKFSNGTPAVTEKAIGKGKVVALHFDAGAELSRPMGNSALASAFIACLEEYAQPPVKAVAGKDIELRAALKKGNWVAVALFPQRPPAKLTLHIDTVALFWTCNPPPTLPLRQLLVFPAITQRVMVYGPATFTPPPYPYTVSPMARLLMICESMIWPPLAYIPAPLSLPLAPLIIFPLITHHIALIHRQ